MSGFEEIDLSRKFNVLTDDEKFKSGACRWLFGKDFDVLGNVLDRVDEMDDVIKISKPDSMDLQFDCVNKKGEVLTVYLFDEDMGSQRYFLVSKKDGDVGYYSILWNNGRIFVSNGVFLFDTDSHNDSKEQVRKLA